MNDSGVFAMDSLFNAICVLVTAAFVLTFVPGLTLGKRSSLSMRDRGRALLAFMVLGSVEGASVSRSVWFNERIVAVCVAGLLAGPRTGVAVSVFVTWLTVKYDGSPLGFIGVSMLCGGLSGGWLYQWRPKLAQLPLTGFCLALAISLLRSGSVFFYGPGALAALNAVWRIGGGAVLEGLGTGRVPRGVG